MMDWDRVRIFHAVAGAGSFTRAADRLGLSQSAISRQIGRPSAVRAVGAAVGRNPVSIVVPCHRVVGSGGALTGYAGGLPRKAQLLAVDVIAIIICVMTARVLPMFTRNATESVNLVAHKARALVHEVHALSETLLEVDFVAFGDWDAVCDDDHATRVRNVSPSGKDGHA